MDIPNTCYRTSIKGLVLDKDKRFLLCKEENGMWEFPGGGMDFEEEPEECLRREISEENIEKENCGLENIKVLKRLVKDKH